jgi:hypothetical protein
MGVSSRIGFETLFLFKWHENGNVETGQEGRRFLK